MSKLVSQKFRHKQTGRIETNIPLMQINQYEKYDGDLKEGEIYMKKEKREMRITREQFDKIKKGDELKIEYKSVFKSGSHKDTFIVKSRSKSNKYRTEKVTLLRKDAGASHPSYLYKDMDGDRRPSMAYGDLGVAMISYQNKSQASQGKQPEKVLGSYSSKGHRPQKQKPYSSKQGPGSGWHGQIARHRMAAMKGRRG